MFLGDEGDVKERLSLSQQELLVMEDLTPAVDDTIFVGIPCYNRAQGLADTIRCLRQQTHRNWKALICDNASPDPGVAKIARQAAAADDRILYHRHEQNLGSIANFRFAAAQSDRPLFMWASDDDLWHPEFMATNSQLLRTNPDAQLAFGSVNIINAHDHVLFSIERFSRFCSTGNRLYDVQTYLEDPEKSGKANMFYSLFRTTALQQCIEECWDNAYEREYAGDYVFLFSFFCRYPVVTHDACHLFKRQPTSATRKIHWRHPRSYRAMKARELESYIARHRRVAPNDAIADLAESIIRRRQAERWKYAIPGMHRFLAA